MKILIISYYYLPEENPRVFRWSTIVSHWLSSGYDISVITASYDNEAKKTKDSLNVIRVPENLVGRIRYKLSRKNNLNSKQDTNKVIVSNNPKILSKFIKAFYSIVLKKLQWPDFAWTWVQNARKAALDHIENNLDTDVIISISHPFSSHVVGSILKKKYPDIRWILDIGDPFCFLSQSQPNNFRIYNRLNKFIEKKYFSLSDFVSVTTPETRSEYVKLFPESTMKIKVIPPVLSNQAQDVLKKINKNFKQKNKKLRLVYIGTLYSGIRHPKKMLDMLAKVRYLLKSDFEIHFFGPTNDIDISELINSYTFFHGSVSHDAALQHMLDADILINIGNSTKFQLPSKLIEYVCSGNPVLNIISSTNDSSQNFLANYQMTLTIELSGEITNAIVSEVSNYIESASSDRLISNNYSFSNKHTVQNISKQYELLFY